MRTVVLVLALVLLVPVALASGTQSRAYVATAAPQTVCQPAMPADVNGACFLLDGSETTVAVSIADASGLPIGALLAFAGPGPGAGTGTPFCGETTVAVPPGSFVLAVGLSQSFSAQVCLSQGTLGGVPTAGAVTAAFS